MAASQSDEELPATEASIEPDPPPTFATLGDIVRVEEHGEIRVALKPHDGARLPRCRRRDQHRRDLDVARSLKIVLASAWKPKSQTRGQEQRSAGKDLAFRAQLHVA